MTKNLFNRACNEAVVNRIGLLQPDSTARWGTMNATEMLLHCNRIHEQLLTAPASRKGTRVKQLLTRWLVLYLSPGFPKNARTPRRNDTKGQIDATAFAEEKQRFVDLVRRFPVHPNPIELPHPYFGDLNTKQWGLAAYKHVNHHLRQFGL